jgi:hypothetical protein
VRQAIGGGEVIDRVQGEVVALDRIGAGIGDHRVVDGHESAVAPESGADLVDLLAVGAEGGEVLAPAAHPLDRAPETEGSGGHDHLLACFIHECTRA